MPANGVLQAMRFQQFLFLLQGSLRIEPCIRKPENEKNPTECWLRKRSAMKRYLMRVGDFRVHFNFKWKSESEVTQSGQTLYNLMDCSLSGSSVHGIFQARILEWVAISFSRRSFWPRDWTRVFRIVGRCFTVWATMEVLKGETKSKKHYKPVSPKWIWNMAATFSSSFIAR